MEAQKKDKEGVTVKVVLPKRLHRQVKAIGVLKERTMQEIIIDALQEWVGTQDIKSLI